jgi:phosphoribosylglycinamide formyltransferase-1
MIRIAILASGSGSNAENIVQHFNNHPEIKVSCIVCNRRDAKVFQRAKKLEIPSHYFPKSDFYQSEKVLHLLKEQADWIVLAGFLLKIPQNILDAFPDNIVNIHPALLPKFGGKGMYGMHVHKAVREMNETETGITIHRVNENYDEGAVLYQAKTFVSKSDTPEDIAAKIHLLEQKHFPKVIENTILQQHSTSKK